MALTSEEKKNILSDLLSSLQTNSKAIEDLPSVADVSDSDSFEISGGRRVTHAVLIQKVKSLYEERIKAAENAVVGVTNSKGQPNGIANLDSSGKIPQDLLYDDFALHFRSLYQYSLGDGCEYAETTPDGVEIRTEAGKCTWYSNKYYSEIQANTSTNRPGGYFYCGQWLTYGEALQLYLDRWNIGSCGQICHSVGNVPVSVKSGDTGISLDYMACQNSYSRILCVGRLGWRSEIMPKSMKRAFDGASALQSVIGVIDCSLISSKSDMRYAFRNASKLKNFCLRNIPEAIPWIDLSGCSSLIIQPFPRNILVNGVNTNVEQDTEYVSSLLYLNRNANASGLRSGKLIVKLSSAVYQSVIDQMKNSQNAHYELTKSDAGIVLCRVVNGVIESYDNMATWSDDVKAEIINGDYSSSASESATVVNSEQPFRELFNVALADNAVSGEQREYPDSTLESSTGWYTNGYHADGPNSSSKYFAYGRWYNYENARLILEDRWIPGIPGITMAARANVAPKLTSATGGCSLNLSYALANNYQPYSLTLGRDGWDSVCYPSSLFRAFDAAENLVRIIGIIDCRDLTSQRDVYNAFANAPLLTQFCLRNIPDPIKWIDLSTCGKDYSLDGEIDPAGETTILTGFPRQLSISGTLRKCESATGTGSSYFLSPLRYLAENYNGKINGKDVRTSALGVRIPRGVFEVIKADYNSSTLGWYKFLKGEWGNPSLLIFFTTYTDNSGNTVIEQLPDESIRELDSSVKDEVTGASAAIIDDLS